MANNKNLAATNDKFVLFDPESLIVQTVYRYGLTCYLLVKEGKAFVLYDECKREMDRWAAPPSDETVAAIHKQLVEFRNTTPKEEKHDLLWEMWGKTNYIFELIKSMQLELHYSPIDNKELFISYNKLINQLNSHLEVISKVSRNYEPKVKV